MDYQTLVDNYWPQQALLFKDLLKTELEKQGEILVQAAEHQVLSGGKRLRAILPVGVYTALQQEPLADLDPTLWAGLATELFHNATLCHDDIADQDRFRRGIPTAWAQFGLPHALNTGDYLLALADEALLAMPLEAQLKVQCLQQAKRLQRMVFLGQSLEFTLGENQQLPTPDIYQHIILGKTGALFALCFVLGGCLARREPQEILALENLGFDLGELFQIQDDLLDLVGDKGRQVQACDLWEGKPSWLITHCVQALTSEEQAKLKRLLYMPRQQKTENEVEQIMQFLRQTQSIAEGLSHFEVQQSQLRQNLLQSLPALQPLVTSILDKIAQPLRMATIN